MKVRVYFNLHKNIFSIQTYIKGKGWRLYSHSENIMLENVEFKVYESGRQRVLKTKEKSVHAYVIGSISPIIHREGHEEITYNPYKYSTFVSKQSKESVLYSKYASLFIEEGKPKILSY